MEGLLRELHLTGTSLFTGVWLMMSYDVLRAVRIVIRHNAEGIDLCFLSFQFLYQENDGILKPIS